MLEEQLSALKEKLADKMPETRELPPGHEIPAIRINRCHLNFDSEGVRVTFGEEVGSTDVVTWHFCAYFGKAAASRLARGILDGMVEMAARQGSGPVAAPQEGADNGGSDSSPASGRSG